MSHPNILRLHRDQRGVGLVAAMLALSILAVLALIVAVLAGNEKQTVQNEWTWAGSFHAADAGGEAAVGWLLEQPGAPPIPNYDTDTIVASRGQTPLDGSQRYRYRMDFLRMAHRPGNGVDFPDFFYRVDTSGEAGVDGESRIEVVLSKQVPLGY